MFASEAVQFEPDRQQPMAHAPLLKCERVNLGANPLTQYVQEAVDAGGVGHRDVPSWLRQ